MERFIISKNNQSGIAKLSRTAFNFSFLNLFLVAAIGFMLRSYPFTGSIPFVFKNLLHAHSHFALGGWVMPALTGLIMVLFPEIVMKIKQWKWVVALILLSAYGMLFTFPFYGYAVSSIVFSTLSVGAGTWLAILIFSYCRRHYLSVPHKFLQWGAFYLLLSFLGPLATGPLIAMGHQGQPIYFNAVYFYLHFQYNGWFTFVILAIIYRMMQNAGITGNSSKTLLLLNISCAPSYLLSVLWTEPHLIVNIVAGISAIIQIMAVLMLLKDVRPGFQQIKTFGLLQLLLAALVIKSFMQLAGAIPYVAVTSYAFKNFIIGYLHLVLLGFVSLFIIMMVLQFYRVPFDRSAKSIISLFLFGFIATEMILFLQPSMAVLNRALPFYKVALLVLAFVLFISAGLLFRLAIMRSKTVYRFRVPLIDKYVLSR